MVVLSPETEKLLEERLKASQYESADELIKALLNAFGPLDEETLDALDRAEDQIERGEVHKWEDFREEFLKQQFKK